MNKDNIIFYIVISGVVGLLIGFAVARQKYTVMMSIKDDMIIERGNTIDVLKKEMKALRMKKIN